MLKPSRKKRRVKVGSDERHLKAIRALPCCCGGSNFSVAHHLMHEPREGKLYGLSHGTGKRNADKWTIPLSPEVHTQAHLSGRPEEYIQKTHGINPWELAQNLYAASGDHDAMIAAIFRARLR